MKRYILMIMCCVATMMTYAQYGECIQVNEFSPTISRWGESHDPTQPERFECWEVDLGVQAHAKITYIVNLENVAYYDYVHIYEIDENGNAIHLRSFCGCTESGSIVTNSTTGKIRIEYLLVLGDCNDTFDGFRIHIEQATCCDLVNHDHYILGKLGIGTTQPQEMLHVNGAIRGGGANGEVTLKGDNGSVTIGATDAQTMTFNTDKSKFVFNKPIYNKSGIYDSWSNTNLQFNTNGTNRMVILSNGNVGIGTQNPETELHIDSGKIKVGSTILGQNQSNILQFGDGSYVQIGEWEKDDILSFKASSYNFISGNVGIGITSPRYKLDVAGTIRAEEILVKTTGADFVFDENYQLLPLNEVESFITENKHLPEIKSAQEMQENGVNVSELQTKLLQKIEELTLYILQQEKRILALETELKK